jgi:hypothetical protein
MIPMTATDSRNLAAQLAHTDPARGLVIARRIKDPWFACQALAWVARYCAEEEFEQIIKEAFRAGGKAEDPYKTVASAAWPVRALVERGHLGRLLSIITELKTQAGKIDLLASRSESLFLVFQAVFPAGREYWLDVLHALQESSEPMINWRQGRNLRDAVWMVWEEDEGLAKSIIDNLEPGRLKRQIESRIASERHRLPRPFFW